MLKLWDIQQNAAFFPFPKQKSRSETEDPLDNKARNKTSINSGSVEQKV